MIIPPEKLTLFIAASLGLLLVPGPAVLYIVTRSLSQGRTAGVVSVLGINMGALTHAVAAALGLSAILLTSAVAFSAVKYAGAAYLIYLGIRQFFSQGAFETVGVKRDRLLRVFVQGYLVSIFNPKLAIFMFAFLPQFVDPNHGSPAIQMLLLGVLFAALAVLSDGTYALLASVSGHWLKRHPHFVKRQKYVTGSVYIGLGVSSVFIGSNHK